MLNFEQRSQELELMDNPDIKPKDLEQALADIKTVNRMLGGNSITINTVFDLMQTVSTEREITILDIGCGDGEMLRSIGLEAKKRKKKVRLIGWDIHEECLNQARSIDTIVQICFEQKNILKPLSEAPNSIDIIISTLTLHHLTNDEVTLFLQKSVEMASMGIVINDLQRSRLAYRLFQCFSFFFIKGFVAKNDGLVSIQRGFVKKELESFADRLVLKHSKIKWRWAFRYCWMIEL